MWTFSEALLYPGIEVCGDEHQRKQDLNHIVVLLPSKSQVTSVRVLNVWLQRVYSPTGNAKLIPSATEIDLSSFLPSQGFLQIGYLFNGLVIAFSGQRQPERRLLKQGRQAATIQEGMFHRVAQVFLVLRYFQEARNQSNHRFPVISVLLKARLITSVVSQSLCLSNREARANLQLRQPQKALLWYTNKQSSAPRDRLTNNQPMCWRGLCEGKI